VLHEGLITKGLEPAPTKASNIAGKVEFAMGDIEKGFAESDVIIERSYTTEAVHQGYIEPHAVVASVAADGMVNIWCSSQGQFMVRAMCSYLTGLPQSDIRAIPAEIGGGFGGNRGGDRFESRGAPRFEGNRGGDRFEGRGDRFENRGAPAPRFEGRPEGRPEGRFEPRGDFRGEQRSFAPRGGEGRFEPRGDQRPDNRGGDRFEARDNRDSRAPRAPAGRDNARGGAGDRFARGPKVVGAGNFKPHNAGGHAAPKRTGAKVLKVTRG
jgi:hypothetical protein